MDINYHEIAERAASHALKSNITLDYSEKSIAEVESILGTYYDHLAEYDGKEGADTLWNVAVHYGIYLGETMLRLGMKEKGFACIQVKHSNLRDAIFLLSFLQSYKHSHDVILIEMR